MENLSAIVKDLQDRVHMTVGRCIVSCGAPLWLKVMEENEDSGDVWEEKHFSLKVLFCCQKCDQIIGNLD